MKGAANLFRFLSAASARGERTALVTITDVIGQSSRAPGTHMAVTQSGDYHGSLSGGCVEAAVVGEALRVIASGATQCLRFGMGSPYIDIRLPCGGGLDLMFVPDPPADVIEEVLGALEERVPLALAIGRDGTLVAERQAALRRTGWSGQHFIACHHPDLRLMIAGHGAETEALARLAHAYGADVVILSPDTDIVARATAAGAPAFQLETPGRSAHLHVDAFTAVVVLFHDHEWELDLLEQALEQDALFIGAMGSRATQVSRLEALRLRGVSEDLLARLTGPIGLIPATRDPETLALSALSQLAGLYQSQIAKPWLYSTHTAEPVSALADQPV